MRVYELIDLFLVHYKITIFDVAVCEEVFCGYSYEVDEKYRYCEVVSIDDNSGKCFMCIDIDTSEEY